MCRIFFSTLFFFLVNVYLTYAQDGVVVTDVKITFFVPARTEDKDVSTQISATLYTSMGKRVAMLDRCCGNIHYPDANFTSSSYELDMRNTISKSEMQSGYLDVHIDPATTDKWVFTPTLYITFSDGTKALVKGEDDTTPFTKRLVTQDIPDTSFPFHL